MAKVTIDIDGTGKNIAHVFLNSIPFGHIDMVDYNFHHNDKHLRDAINMAVKNDKNVVDAINSIQRFVNASILHKETL